MHQFLKNRPIALIYVFFPSMRRPLLSPEAQLRSWNLPACARTYGISLHLLWTVPVCRCLWCPRQWDAVTGISSLVQSHQRWSCRTLSCPPGVVVALVGPLAADFWFASSGEVLLPTCAFSPRVPLPESGPWLRYSSSLSPGSVGTYVGPSFASSSSDWWWGAGQTAIFQGAGLFTPLRLAAYLQRETRSAFLLSWRSSTFWGVFLCGINRATRAPLPWMTFCDQMNWNALIHELCARAERSLFHSTSQVMWFHISDQCQELWRDWRCGRSQCVQGDWNCWPKKPHVSYHFSIIHRAALTWSFERFVCARLKYWWSFKTLD